MQIESQTITIAESLRNDLDTVLAIGQMCEIPAELRQRLGIKKDAVLLSRTIKFDNRIVIDFDVMCSKTEVYLNIQAYVPDADGQVGDPIKENALEELKDWSFEHKGVDYRIMVETEIPK